LCLDLGIGTRTRLRVHFGGNDLARTVHADVDEQRARGFHIHVDDRRLHLVPGRTIGKDSVITEDVLGMSGCRAEEEWSKKAEHDQLVDRTA
jgi:hypothetical protein